MTIKAVSFQYPKNHICQALPNGRQASDLQNTRTVIVLLGPTGVGKTGASILLAKALNTEIISADSMQIYRKMDIGTAKPSSRELKEVKHHLIDILSPKESFSAGLFRQMAVKIIDGLHKKGKIPLVAGGTGLYIRALTQGLFEGPAADWPLREKLMRKEEYYGKGHLYKLLKRIDPASSEKINPADTRRIIRGIEVALKAGRTISDLQKSSTVSQNYNFIKIGLTRDRKELYGRIEQRVDKMLDEGLVDEVRKILKLIEVEKVRGSEDKKKPTDKNSKTSHLLNFLSSFPVPSLQALGYKEILLYINGSASLDEAKRLLKKRTKMFAKRQLTWFRKEPGIIWVDITGLTEPGKVLEKIIKDVAIPRKLLYVNKKT